MPPTLPAGPYEMFDVGLAEKVPLYLITFDEDGVCTSPQTRAALLAAAAERRFSDLFLFSHGWNNDFPTAMDRYRGFIGNFRKARERVAAFPAGYAPLLVGIFWPSTALVFGNEKGPDIAAAPVSGLDRDAALGDELREAQDVAAVLTPDEKSRFYELVMQPTLRPAEAQQLAAMLLPHVPTASLAGEERMQDDVTPGDLVMLWRQLESELGVAPAPVDDDDESFGSPGAPNPAAPNAAGLLSPLDPRNALRLFTVFRMKDRAGRVGSVGVSPLLRDLLAAAGPTKSHLVGHSYGCKVVLSAIASGPPLAKAAVTSVLLLQPAINFWCFAANVDGEGFPGGYHRVAEAVKQPILSTFTPHDFALRRTFHLVLTRKGDLGEVKIAGALEPDRYGGLGGWGPRGCPAPLGLTVPMPAAGTAYPALTPGPLRILALDAERTIHGHGDVITDHTAWALLQQVLAG